MQAIPECACGEAVAASGVGMVQHAARERIERAAAGSLLLGSVTYGVVHRANLPVTFVK